MCFTKINFVSGNLFIIKVEHFQFVVFVFRNSIQDLLDQQGTINFGFFFILATFFILNIILRARLKILRELITKWISVTCELRYSLKIIFCRIFKKQAGKSHRYVPCAYNFTIIQNRTAVILPLLLDSVEQYYLFLVSRGLQT